MVINDQAAHRGGDCGGHPWASILQSGDRSTNFFGQFAGASGTTPIRLVTVSPSRSAAAPVRSQWPPRAKGPRSITGSTSERPRYVTATWVPHGNVLWAPPMVVLPSRVPQAVFLP